MAATLELEGRVKVVNSTPGESGLPHTHLEGGPALLGQKPKLHCTEQSAIILGKGSLGMEENSVSPSPNPAPLAPDRHVFVTPSVPDSHPESISNFSSDSDMDFVNPSIPKRPSESRIPRKSRKKHK